MKQTVKAFLFVTAIFIVSVMNLKSIKLYSNNDLNISSLTKVALADGEGGYPLQCYRYYDEPNFWHNDFFFVFCESCDEVKGHDPIILATCIP